MRSPQSEAASVPKAPATAAAEGLASRRHRPAHPHDGLLNLQRRYGNRGVRDVIQAKLNIGPVDDPLEREADRVALLATGSSPAASAQRAPEAAQHVPAATGGAAEPGVARAVERARGGGLAVPGGVRARMERATGADLGSVRLHVGSESDRLNHALGSRAFTVGADVFVRRSEYRPGTARGDALLGHELTHTVQQGAARAHPSMSTGATRKEPDHGVARDHGTGLASTRVQRRVVRNGIPVREPLAEVEASEHGALLTATSRRVLEHLARPTPVLVVGDTTELFLEAKRIAAMVDSIDSILAHGVLGRRELNRRNIDYQGSNDAASDHTPLAVNVLDARGAGADFHALVAGSLTVDHSGSFSVAMERPVQEDVVAARITANLTTARSRGPRQDEIDQLVTGGMSEEMAQLFLRMNREETAIADAIAGNQAVFDQRVQNTVMAVVIAPDHGMDLGFFGNRQYESQVEADRIPPGPGGFTVLLIPQWFAPYATLLRPQLAAHVTFTYVDNARITAGYSGGGQNNSVTTNAPDYATALRQLLRQHRLIATHIVKTGGV
ncbi:eCIS core domain-containing protein [Streptomyces sp. NPDC000878]